jgi:hypothetical protein
MEQLIHLTWLIQLTPTPAWTSQICSNEYFSVIAWPPHTHDWLLSTLFEHPTEKPTWIDLDSSKVLALLESSFPSYWPFRRAFLSPFCHISKTTKLQLFRGFVVLLPWCLIWLAHWTLTPFPLMVVLESSHCGRKKQDTDHIRARVVLHPCINNFPVRGTITSRTIRNQVNHLNMEVFHERSTENIYDQTHQAWLVFPTTPETATCTKSWLKHLLEMVTRNMPSKIEIHINWPAAVE